MLSIVVDQAPLKQIVDSLFLVDEALVQVSEDGLRTRVVNEANTAKAQIRIDSGAFDSYEANQRTICADIKTLSEVVGQANSGDLIQIELVDDGTTLLANIAGQEYYISLINPRGASPPGELPTVDSAVNATLDAEEFRGAIEAADTFSEEMTIRTHSEGGLVLEGRGDDNRTKKHLSDAELESFEGGEADSTYNLDYLKDIRTALNGSETVHIGLGVDRPLHIEFDFIQGFGEAEYFIAPYIEND